MTATMPMTPVVTLFGERFHRDSTIPDGDFVWQPGATGHGHWNVNNATLDELHSRSNGVRQSIIGILKQRRREGQTVATGVVQPGTHKNRTPIPSKPRKANLDDLQGRAKALIVQVGTLLDAGPIPPGQMAEISQTYASLQRELDEVREQVSEIEEHVSMARGLVIEFATAP